MHVLSRAGALIAVALALSGAAPQPSSVRLLRQLLATIATGDQQAYERFVAAHYSAAALADTPAALQASALARVYDDTGGFTVDRIASASGSSVEAEARDRMTGTRQCLTLKLSGADGLSKISEFSSRALYPSGRNLASVSTDELVRTISTVAERFSRRGLLSGVILIGSGDRVAFQKAFGFASIAHHDPMTLTTHLNVASIGKSITGAAIAQLVDQGRLSYDSKVGEVLPDYPDKRVRDAVTIRQLLSHTSGLGPDDYYEKPEWDSAKPLLRSVPDYVKLIEREGISLGLPQGQYLYSNTGYVRLGVIIEKITGESFYDYVRRTLFGPAHMSSSFYGETDSEQQGAAEPLTNLFDVGPNSYIYRLGTPRRATYELAARGGPQGGATLTAGDLFRFFVGLRNGTLVSPARLKEMLTPQSASGAGAAGLVGDAREGLGIEVVGQNGHIFYGHTGGDLGVAASAYWYPDSGHTVIILTNRDPRAARVLTNVSRALLTRRTVAGAMPAAQQCFAGQP
jgi:D-alanyl-D-alanine carboxypeptidase